MAVLKEILGPETGHVYSLDRPKSVLGRHPDCDLILDVGAVSRYHAQIVRVGDEFYLEDLGSRNGTFLNGQLVQGRIQLDEGDHLRICDVAFCFHISSETDAHKTPSDGSGYAPVLIDDAEPISSIMSKIDISSGPSGGVIGSSAKVKLDALIEITRNLGRVLALDEVLPQVLNSLFKIFIQADRGFIVLKEDDGRLIPRWTKLRQEYPDDSLRISRTIINQVIESKEVVLSADAASDVRFDMSQSIADFRIRSMMCAPLLDGDGNAMGVLQIDTLDQRNRFREEDLEVLASVAAQAGVAIDNARLHERALKQRSLQRDLELARQVQRGFLPQRSPELPGYRFFHYYRAANQVGGDYYDYIELPDGRMAIVVADVVGHGVAAALLMTKLSAETRFSLAIESSPAAAMTRLNATLFRDLLEDRFVTLVMTVLNPVTDEVTVVNAGHMPPLYRNRRGELLEIGRAQVGLPLAIADDTRYEQSSIRLEPGELLVMYTDGVNESMNQEGILFGIERIHELTCRNGDDPEALGQTIIDRVKQFVGNREQVDDMCLVCFGRV